jgi:hypothetical protein
MTDVAEDTTARPWQAGPALRRAHWVYLIGAVSNWLVTVPAFVAYDRYVDAFIDVRPNYPALVWIWSGMAFLWGIAFFEISRDPLRAYPLVKYSWLEKIVTSTSIVVGWAIGDIPARLAVGVVFTDMIWIPLFIWVHLGLAPLARSARYPGTPGQEHADATG